MRIDLKALRDRGWDVQRLDSETFEIVGTMPLHGIAEFADNLRDAGLDDITVDVIMERTAIRVEEALILRDMKGEYPPPIARSVKKTKTAL